MSMHQTTRAPEQKRAEKYARRAGYKSGGAVSDEAQDRKMVEKGVHEHEAHLHKGEKKTRLKLKAGGAVPGKKPTERLDKRARGGRSKGHGKVNIIIHSGAGDQEKQAAMQQGMRVGAAMGAKAAAARGAPPAPGGPPAGLPPRPPMGATAPGAGPAAPPQVGPRPMMANRGGRTKDTIKVRAHVRRKAGGRV